MAKWKKDSEPQEIINRLDEARRDAGGNSVAFSGFVYPEYLLVLGGMLELDTGIPELEQRKIIGASVRDAGNAGRITAEILLRECRKHERNYSQKPKISYRLRTGISVSHLIKIPTTKILSSTITFNPKNDVSRKNHQQLYESAKGSLGFELPARYTTITVSLTSRSPSEAAQCALDAIDLIRAIWNLLLNRTSRRISSGRPKPVNDILLSPFHTIHNQDGSLATTSWWYDPSYRESSVVFSDNARFKSVIDPSKRLRNQLAASKYKDDIANALIRYVRALDSTDLNDTFLRLWSVLEFLTGSTSSSYKVAIRRAAFLFSDYDYSFQALTQLMNHRNRFVHAGSETAEIELLVYMLKRYVDQLLFFHIATKYKFESRIEAAEFMSFPHCKEILRTRRKRIQQAIQFVS